MTENNYYNNKKRKASRDLNNKDQLFTIGSFIVDVSPTIESNTATLSLDNTSIDLVQTQYRGHLELPDRDLNPVVQFNTNGYNYATALDIDVSNVDISPPGTDVNDNEISVSIPADPNWVDDDDAEGVVNIDDFLNNELVNDNQFDERYATSINIDLSAFREQCYKDMQLQSNENETKSGTIPFEIKSNGTYTIGDFDNVEGQEIVKDNQNRRGKMTIVKSDSIKDTKDVESTPFKPPNVGTFVVNVPIQSNKEQTIHENNSITTITPDTGYDAMQRVTVTVDVPENDPYLYDGEIGISTEDNNKTIGELMNEQSIEAQGLSPECTLNVIDNTEPNLQSKIINYPGFWIPQDIYPDSNYDGLSSVTFNYNNNECVKLIKSFAIGQGNTQNGVTVSYNEGSDDISFIFNDENYNENLQNIYQPYGYGNIYITFNDNVYNVNKIDFMCVDAFQCNFYVYYNNDWLLLYSFGYYTENSGYSHHFNNDKYSNKYKLEIKEVRYGGTEFWGLRLWQCGDFKPVQTDKVINIVNNNSTAVINPDSNYSSMLNCTVNVNIPSDVNNYNNYNSSSPFQIEYSETNNTGVINIPEGYTGLGEIHFEIVKAKKRAVKYGLNYGSQTKYLISSMLSAGGNYTIHRYYGEGNTTQIFINPTTNQVISLASSGDSWQLYVPSTFKHDELGTGNNDTTNYSLCLYDENDNVIYSLRNQIGSSGSYTKYVNTIPSDIEIVV